MIQVKTTGKHVTVDGTSLKGYIKTTYANLVKAFGNQTYSRPSADRKVRICWNIEFADGTVATIYDWKNSGKSTKWVKENCLVWNIGGYDKQAVNRVLDVLMEKQVEFINLPYQF